MFNPISPEFVRIIHDEKVREIESRNELIRIARERGEYETGNTIDQWRAWYAQASEWLKVKLFHRAPAISRPITQPESFDKNCQVVPC